MAAAALSTTEAAFENQRLGGLQLQQTHRQIACVSPSFIQSASAHILAARGERFSLIKVFARDPKGA